MSGWKEFTLNEIADFPPVVKLYRGYEYSFIKMEDISVGQRFVLPEEKRRYENSSCSKFGNDDILFARITPCLENGKIAQVKLRKNNSGFGSTEFFVFRGKKEKLNQSFLYYLAKSDLIWKSAVNSMVGASGRQRADSGFLGNLRFRIPLLPIQRKIAAVLSAYDDLIENNNRRIAILEKMAEELYREWFVRLRFPGHEKVKIVKGVPDGWEPKRLKEVVDRKSFRKIYRESELQPDGRIIVIDQSVNEYLGFYDGEPEHRASENRPIMLFGDHSCKMQIMIEPFSLAENVIPFVAKGKMPTAFLFYMIHNSIETTEYKRHWTELINKEIYIPKEHLQIEFAEKAITHIHQKEKLVAMNRRIKIIRDRLLSRLMSGKIDVENLDIQFPDSMKEEAAANA
jgi:type I restriction enzyme S subunit